MATAAIVAAALLGLAGPDQAAAQTATSLVISQVYGGGGNTGATYTHDFIAIFNPTSASVDVTGWSVQYAAATGSTWSRTTLTGVVEPGRYYLIQQARGAGGSTSLPPPDATGTIAMSATSGKVALVASMSSLSGACPVGGAIVDFVGYGTANCFEGAGAAPGLDNATAALRAGHGCIDTNNNATDFSAGAPAPQNSLSPEQSCAPPRVVISQVYGGGGNAGALFTHDFIEIFNAGPGTASLSGWSVQYASAAGTSWQVTPLSGTMPAGGYYLVQQAAGGGGTLPLPAADATGTINLSATSGKVALVRSTAALAGACPASLDLADLVGYGTANCFEGGAGAPALNNTHAAFRRDDGCTDTDDNRADFVGAPAAPRHSASPLRDCSIDPTPFRWIHAIQGAGARSPHEGEVVWTQGVVTGVRANGFYLQTVPVDADGDPRTSEGLLVFTGTGHVPAEVAVGRVLRVRGRVTEFARGAAESVTELTALSGLVVLREGEPLPPPVPVTRADLTPGGGLLQLEHLEGMRVSMDALVAVSPTLGVVNEAQAIGIENGVFYAVLAGEARPFREPGIQAPAVPPPCAAGADCAIPIFDANPERVRVDSAGQIGAVPLTVTTGALLADVAGVLDYDFGTWTLVPDPAPALAVTGLAAPTPAPRPGEDHFTVASFNMQRFFDPVPPGPAVTPEAFARRLAKASLIIREYLHLPDVIGVQEVEHIGVLHALAAQVNADAEAAGLGNPGYAAHLEEGNDPGGIDVGFLVRARVLVHEVVQWGADEAFINPLTGQPEVLNDRPPLALRATVDGPPHRMPAEVIVVNNHLRSLIGIDEVPGGTRVRAKRRAQAEYLAGVLQQLQETYPAVPILSIGDYNAFEVNDGYVDVLGTVRGAPAPPTQVVLASADLVQPHFLDAGQLLPPAERYSFVFDGNAQSLDHVLYSAAAAPAVASVGHARINADFPVSYAGDPDRPERFSDHDPALAVLRFPADTVAPVIHAASPAVNTLWPPDGRMVPVDLFVEATDNRSAVSCGVADVSSSEPVRGPGAGQTAPDWTIDGPLAVSLRAQRLGRGTGRVYTITVHCADAAGNTAAAVVAVAVPHDRR